MPSKCVFTHAETHLLGMGAILDATIFARSLPSKCIFTTVEMHLSGMGIILQSCALRFFWWNPTPNCGREYFGHETTANGGKTNT